MKNASLSSRPESWHVTQIGFEHPTFSGRVGFRPNQAWNFGLSASEGPYFRPGSGTDVAARPRYRRLSRIRSRSGWVSPGTICNYGRNFTRRVSRFRRSGNADTFAYYVEAKYKFTPQLFGALRWNQQLFSNVNDGDGGRVRWSQDSGADRHCGYLPFYVAYPAEAAIQFSTGNHWPGQ